MEIQVRVKLERPRWARLPRRRRTKVGVALSAALLMAAPVAWATDRFVDVPTASVHHNDVDTIAAAGITGGCNPPTNNLYCPGDAVRRDQMASFLTRGLGRIAVSQSLLGNGIVRGAGFTNIAEVTIDVGGTGAAAKQYVRVDASLNVWDTAECECRFVLRFVDVSTNDISGVAYHSTPASFSTHGTTHPAVGVFDASPGSHTYRLQMNYEDSEAGGGPQTLNLFQPYLIATTFPFQSGTSQIDTAAAPATR